MSPVRNAVVFVLIASAMVATTAYAPTPSAAAESITQSAKSAADDVSKWTQKQWTAAKAKWAKEKDKWSFIYDCMTS
jgi:hypothetical protein